MGLEGEERKRLTNLMTLGFADDTEANELHRKIVPFVACGDLSGYDSDRTYELQVG